MIVILGFWLHFYIEHFQSSDFIKLIYSHDWMSQYRYPRLFWISEFLFHTSNLGLNNFLLVVTHELCGPLFFLLEVWTELWFINFLIACWCFGLKGASVFIGDIDTFYGLRVLSQEARSPPACACSHHLVEIWSWYMCKALPGPFSHNSS